MIVVDELAARRDKAVIADRDSRSRIELAETANKDPVADQNRRPGPPFPMAVFDGYVFLDDAMIADGKLIRPVDPQPGDNAVTAESGTLHLQK